MAPSFHEDWQLMPCNTSPRCTSSKNISNTLANTLATHYLQHQAAMHVPEFNEAIVTAGKDGLGVVREACAVDFVLVPVESV